MESHKPPLRRRCRTDLLYLGFVSVAALRSIAMLRTLGVHETTDTTRYNRNLALKYAPTPQPTLARLSPPSWAPVAHPPSSAPNTRRFDAMTTSSSPTTAKHTATPTHSPTNHPTRQPTHSNPPTRLPTHSPTSPPTMTPVVSHSPEQSMSSAPLAAAAVIAPLSMVEFNDCRTLAPCHVAGDDSNLTCAVFYAQRFWDAAPLALQTELQHQRDHRPLNCWYETEMLWLQRVHNATTTTTPYPQAVCHNAIPEHLVYYHMFKVGGTTSRNALGLFGFPNYESRHVFSDQLKRLFPNRLPLPGNFTDYLRYVDDLKQEAYDKQVVNPRSNLGFTFVRSPVQRFLSGLEQIQRLDNTAWEVSPEAQPCFDMPDALAKVECVVDAIQTTRVFFNVHLYPQAYLFDVWTQHGTYDLAIHVLDLQDMDALFKRFKGKIVRRVRVSTANNTQLHLVDHDLEPRLLKKICQLYQADLLMLQVLQNEDPLCAEALGSSSP